MARSRKASSEGRSSSLSPSMTIRTSNSLEGKRRVTSWYILYSSVSDRNNWLSESSTFNRMKPTAARAQSTTKMIAHNEAVGSAQKADPLNAEREIARLYGALRLGRTVFRWRKACHNPPIAMCRNYAALDEQSDRGNHAPMVSSGSGAARSPDPNVARYNPSPSA